MQLNRMHSLVGRMVNYLAVIAFVLSGSVSTHAKDFTGNHHELAAYHKSGVADDGHHRHPDMPGKQCSQSNLIHCGADYIGARR